MIYSDKQLICSECGVDFTFSSGEQEQYAQLGFLNDPGRCPVCRTEQKVLGGQALRDSSAAWKRLGPPGPMYPAVCADCGQVAEVPVQPRGDRPVYCSDCFTRKKMNGAR